MEETPNIAVKNLQTYLREISLHYPEITTPPVDGIFEEQTRQSLLDFQKARELPTTGIADQETWEALYEAYRLVIAANEPPQKMAVFPNEDNAYVLAENDVGFPVTALQYMLTELEAFYGELENLPMTGVLDEPTKNAVQTFQRQNGIPPTGDVGKTTWNLIVDQYNQFFSSNPPCN